MNVLKSSRIFQAITILVILGIIGVFSVSAINRNQAIYIGVVTSNKGPYADEKAQFINGAQIMANELNRNSECQFFLPLNRRCGINGHMVRIQPIQSEADAQNVSAVIGDFQGDSSWNSSAYYEERSIPTLLISPTNENLDDSKFVFRMAPGNTQIGVFLANYARQDIGALTASIVFDSNDPNSVALRDGFQDPFTSLAVLNKKTGVAERGAIIKTWDWSDPAINKDTIVNNILAPGKEKNPGLIFLAIDAEKSVDLLAEMHRKGIRNIVIGNTDLAGETFNQKYSSYPEEQTQPGYFTDGMYAVSPILFDGANQSAQNFIVKFKAEFNNEPTWAAVLAYDAVHALDATLNNQSVTHDFKANREKIQEGLKNLDGIKGSDYGITGKTYFQFQNSGKPISVGMFTQGRFISAPVQYYPVEDARFVPDFKSKLDDGRIVTQGGYYYYKTDIAYSGVNFNEISNIDENKPSYFVDFYLWFRYRSNENDQITTDTLQFINALSEPEVTEIENRLQPIGPNEARTLSNNLSYKLFRVKGEFTSAFDFKEYPFDQQAIEIRFRHNDLLRENLVFVVDQVKPNEVNDESAAFRSGGDWRVGSSEFYQDSAVIHSALGNPELSQINDPNIEYSTFNARIPISRNLLSFMLRNLLPVLFSIMLAYLSFFLPRTEFGTREGILSGTILSIAFFHLSVSSFLGSIGYTTSLDNIFYIFYAIILLGLGTTLLEWLKELEVEKLTKELEELRSGTEQDQAVTKQQIEELSAKIKQNDQAGWKLFKLGQIAYPLILAVIAFGYGYHYRSTIFPAPPASTALLEKATTQSNSNSVLRLGSWRADDREAVEKILAEFKKETGISVVFEPTVNNDYEKILRLQLENGNAPDLIYLSPNGGRVLAPESLYKQGYIENLSNIVPDLDKSFNPADLKTWQTKNEAIYGIPIYAVSHGVYYNKTIFDNLGLKPPKTWEEFLTTSQTIKDAGYTPIANGTYEKTDPQRIGDYYFLSIAPTYLQGSSGRLEYEAGKSCYNDARVVAIFKAIQELAPYMADNSTSVSYTDSLQQFYDGNAAMYFSGSFDVKKFKDNLKGELDVFLIPPPRGKTPFVTFHIDTAIGLNAKSAHREDAIKFLKWLTEKHFGELVGANLPGFYPLNKDLKSDPQIISNSDPKVASIAREFLNFNQPGVGLDVRWDLPIAKVPDGRTLMQLGIFDVINNPNDPTAPQRAADRLQNGLAQWYVPAQQCKPIPTPTFTPTFTATPLPTIATTGTPESPFGINVTTTPTP